MKEKYSSTKVAALIPKHWGLTARTVEDIIFFGKITIREMINWWRCTANSLAWNIKDVDKKLNLLQNKGATDICKIAKQYENPKFPHVGVPKHSRSQDLEPLDTASINRKCGATTFNVCGWCKYAIGTVRYNYVITPFCVIKMGAGIKDEERRFNTTCFLKEAPDKIFDEIRKGLTRKRERLIEEKRKTNEKIKFLFALEKRSEKKPAMSNHRPHDWFNVNDPVVCYIGEWKGRVARGNFVTAKVISHHDGRIFVCYDKRVHTGKDLEGHGGTYGGPRPEVVHEWEFKYLLKHPDFARLWSEKGTPEHLEEFDVKRFLNALAKEAVRSKK